MADSVIGISNVQFIFEIQECSCLIDVNHDDAGNEKYTFRIGPARDAKVHRYAYETQQGLVEINPKTGVAIPGRNLTEAFLSLNLSSVDDVAEFIRSYGSFVSYPTDKYGSVEYGKLYTILRRFQLVVSMMTDLTGNDPDYILLCNHMLRLNFGRYYHTTLVENYDYLETCKHPITEYWYDYDENTIYRYISPELSQLPTFMLDEEVNEFEVNDTFRKTKYYLDYQEPYFSFEDFDKDDIAKIPGATELIKLRAFFRSSYPFDADTKLLIDLLFNLIYENEHNLSWRNGTFELNQKLKDQQENTLILSARYEKVIEYLCRHTIKEEFDTALKQVHPSYNSDEMMPSWRIPNLYTALYFSLFYTNPNYEIYRKCANPGCGRVFLVKSSNNRRRYCCSSCQNMAAQARHRTKIKKEAMRVRIS